MDTLNEILAEPLPADMTFTMSTFNIDDLLNTDIDTLKTPRSPRHSTSTRTVSVQPGLQEEPEDEDGTQPQGSRSFIESDLDATENELQEMLNEQLAVKRPIPAPGMHG